MEDNRPVKYLLYGELTEGTRPVGRPKLRYKDTFKSALNGDNNSSNMQQSEREESECKRETKG